MYWLEFFKLALPGGLVPAIILFVFVVLWGATSPKGSVADTFVAAGAGALAAFVVGYVISVPYLYIATPEQVGVAGGFSWVGWWSLIALIVGGFVVAFVTDTQDIYYGLPPVVSGAIWAVVLLGVVIMPVNGINYLVTGPVGGTQQLADIAHVKLMPANDKLPATDYHHLPIVTAGMAQYVLQNKIGGIADPVTGQSLNYGSVYQFDQDQLVIQSIQHHLYWVAPIDYRNGATNAPNHNVYDTPGYGVVDAENPDAPAHIVIGLHLYITQNAALEQNLTRYLYERGYNKCNLVDPTLEIDDSGPASAPWAGHPYYTISCMVPQQQYQGNVMKSLIVLDPTKQADNIAEYDADASGKIANQPGWVDRVYSADTIWERIGWWGQWGQQGTGWWNPSGNGQINPADQSAADMQVLYNTVDGEPVFVEPLTSSNGHDSSSVGIMLCHTQINQCDDYPFNGFGIGSTVSDTFATAPKNLQKYEVAAVQFVNLYGTPTWLATYVRSISGGGEALAGIGLVAASGQYLKPANVQFESDLSSALQDYQQWLADAGSSSGATITDSCKPTTLAGKVVSIVPGKTAGSYEFLLTGSSHIFSVDTTKYAYAPFVAKDHNVTISFCDAGQLNQAVSSFTDNDIASLIGAPPAATATATPTPSPAPSPAPKK